MTKPTTKLKRIPQKINPSPNFFSKKSANRRHSRAISRRFSRFSQSGRRLPPACRAETVSKVRRGRTHVKKSQEDRRFSRRIGFNSLIFNRLQVEPWLAAAYPDGLTHHPVRSLFANAPSSCSPLPVRRSPFAGASLPAAKPPLR